MLMTKSKIFRKCVYSLDLFQRTHNAGKKKRHRYIFDLPFSQWSPKYPLLQWHDTTPIPNVQLPCPWHVCLHTKINASDTCM